jgi:hypothetical protein
MKKPIALSAFIVFMAIIYSLNKKSGSQKMQSHLKKNHAGGPMNGIRSTSNEI